MSVLGTYPVAAVCAFLFHFPVLLGGQTSGLTGATLANFTTGHGHSFGGEYLELVPFERIRYTDRFDDPNLPGEMQTTVTLKQVSCGTEFNVVQEGVPEAIPLEMCYLGWQESLAQLANARRARDSGVTGDA